MGSAGVPRPERVSLKSDDTQIDPLNNGRNNSHPAVSADGNLVAWVTSVQEVVIGLQNQRGRNQVYLRNRSAGTTTLVSRTPSGQPGGAPSNFPVIADNHRVLFTSMADDLVLADTGGKADIFEHDVHTGTTVLLSKRVDGPVQADGDCEGPDASEFGRFVVFTSSATNLVSFEPGLQQQGGGWHPYMDCPAGIGPSADRDDVFLLDRGSGYDTVLPVSQWNEGPSITWISVGNDANGDCVATTGGKSSEPAISANGCRVVFQSLATNLVPGVTPTAFQIYVWDRTTLDVQLVSRVPFVPGNVPGDLSSAGPAISADARWVVFRSMARNLTQTVELDDDDDIYLVDLDSPPFEAVRLDETIDGQTPPDVRAFGGFRESDISPSGRWISISTNIPEYLNFSGVANTNPFDILINDRDINGDGTGATGVSYLFLADPAFVGPVPYGDGWTTPFVRFSGIIDLPGGLEEQIAVCTTAAHDLNQGQSPADHNQAVNPNCMGFDCGDDIYTRVLWRQ